MKMIMAALTASALLAGLAVVHHDVGDRSPRGLLDAATAFLADLRLLRPVPGGVLMLPAAARYRNIKLALPVRHAGDGQMALYFGAMGTDGEGSST